MQESDKKFGGRFKKRDFQAGSENFSKLCWCLIPYIKCMTKMKMLLFAVLFLLAGPVRSTVDDKEDEYLGSVIAISMCRASCLDQFSHLIRNENNCVKESNCFMCWEMCRMIIENFEIWGPLCIVKDVCPPGCQLACNFIQTDPRYDSFTPSSSLTVRNVYESHTDRVIVQWVPNRDLESESVLLYSVLLRDENQSWNQIGQTTSHVMHIKQGLLGRHTEIRVIATNATKQVADTKTSYSRKNITHAISTMKHSKYSWKPHVENILRNTIGLQATITWPARRDENGPMEYEVSWSVIDDTVEITGHLHTTNNAAVLTLWPNSVYSVQVNCFGANKTLHSQSESLVVDTRSYNIVSEVKKVPVASVPSCTEDETFAINSFAVLSAVFMVIIIMTIIWILKAKRNRLMGNNECKIQNKSDATLKHPVKPAIFYPISISQQEEQKKFSSEYKHQALLVI